MTIHNPAGVKLTQDEMDQGWRIPSIDELRVMTPSDAEYWDRFMGMWLDSNYAGEPINYANEKKTTYRTRTPPPSPLDELDELVKFLA